MISAAMAIILASVIVARAAYVCNALRISDLGGRGYVAWELFGLSYCVVAAAAAGSAWQIAHGCGTLCDWGWLIASAGMILTDRRRTKGGS